MACDCPNCLCDHHKHEMKLGRLQGLDGRKLKQADDGGAEAEQDLSRYQVVSWEPRFAEMEREKVTGRTKAGKPRPSTALKEYLAHNDLIIEPPALDLAEWDIIALNTSGGKDSEVMLDVMIPLIDELGLRDRTVVVHADLGRIEWEGTKELAAEQAAIYGFELDVVTRDAHLPPEERRDILRQIEYERKMFPDMANRYCTSDHKTSQVVVQAVSPRVNMIQCGSPKCRATRHVSHRRLPTPRLERTAVQVLNCLGIRGAEGPARRMSNPFSFRHLISSSRREIYNFNPLHLWSVEEIWERIRERDLPYHPAYDHGMSRLSCAFCVFASKKDLLISAQHNKGLLKEYVRVEEKIGHTFRQDLAIRDVWDEAYPGEDPYASEVCLPSQAVDPLPI
jgi:3'-phosphoadenosine 5'-phosphosulfate sulfotransferase (PAPS reductase)/FAD synthetase